VSSINQLWVHRSTVYVQGPNVRCSIQKAQGRGLQYLQSFISILVAVAIIAATELSISWNNIDSINSLDSAGQLIPLVLGIAVVLHVPWAKRSDQFGSYMDSTVINDEPMVFPASRLPRNPGNTSTPPRGARSRSYKSRPFQRYSVDPVLSPSAVGSGEQNEQEGAWLF